MGELAYFCASIAQFPRRLLARALHECKVQGVGSRKVHSRRIFAAVLLSYKAVGEARGEARGEATVHTSCDLSLPAVLVVSLCVERAYKADSARWCYSL